ncbi:MAG: TPM domain-containing protein [Microcoleaceae cyanobacterium MO_207.B10]|nr:TPM domain-containing protein [Microcoleaceae cyanobacterium MO_207.B10]
MNFPLTILRRGFWIIILSLTLLLYPLPSWAITIQDVPNPRQNDGGWVTDMAEMLSARTETHLNKMISELEAKNGSEIAVVTVPETISAATPKQFTTELFNYWGIGKKDKNNGVLFLISQRDRRVEIETGKGVQTILSDATVNNLIDTKIIPKFKLGQFENGIVAGTTELVTSLKGDEYKLLSIVIFIGILIIPIFVIILTSLKNTYKSRKNSYSRSYGGSSRPRTTYRRSTNSSSSSYSDSNNTSRTSYGGYDSCSGSSSGSYDSSSSSGSYDSGSFGGGCSDGGGGGGDW